MTTSPPPKRIVVIGGGISGLCAAYEASRNAARVPGGLEVIVLEAAAEVGGKARSIADDGWLVEAGPTGYLDNEPEFDALLQDAGLADRKVEADPAAARRYLLHGRLREVKAHPLKFAASGLLGPGGLLRIAREPFVPAVSPDEAARESIWDFAARRLGRQAADRLIAPMVLGVVAGDARQLSLQACFPKLADLERRHGSLIRGMLATRKSRSRDQRFATGPSGKLVSFADGLQWVTKALADKSGFEVRCGARVGAIDTEGHVGAGTGCQTGPDRGSPSGAGPDAEPRFRVFIEGDGEPIPADAVIAAGESFANAALIEEIAPRAAEALHEIATPPVAVVALGFGPEVAARFPTGFGVLIPRDQGFRILGCIWDSQLFAGRSPDGHLLARAMLGGGIDPEAGAVSDEQLIGLAAEEVGRIFDIAVAPVYTRVANWPRAIPQYDLDHMTRLARVDTALEWAPGLFLAGNGLHGVAFSKSAVTGIRQGRAAVAWLGQGRAEGSVAQPTQLSGPSSGDLA